jgi:hypothetical protein
MHALDALQREIHEGLCEIPMLDAHTHLPVARLGAQGLHDVLLYHMVVTDLYASGCPSGARLTMFPEWPERAEATGRLREAIPFLPRIRNTSNAWLVRSILADLYDWHDEITLDNWQRLDGQIRERADDAAWAHEILDRANIDSVAVEYVRRDPGEASGRFHYSLEWGFFSFARIGEYDTALRELERCWGRPPESLLPPPATPERPIRTLDDVHAAMGSYLEAIPYRDTIGMATHFSTLIDYGVVDEGQMERALARRGVARSGERDVYASYVTELVWCGLERRGYSGIIQFSLGAEALPFETGALLSQKTIGQLGEIFARHPSLRFQCILGSRHANHALCSLARELPNLSLAGYWWHSFFPDSVRQLIGERLDMLPVNRQVGFFSDAYCVEWSYGKALLVRRELARALAERVAQKQYSLPDALSIARGILTESPQELNGMKRWRGQPAITR